MNLYRIEYQLKDTENNIYRRQVQAQLLGYEELWTVAQEVENLGP
jgi:hypothetical protein